MFSDLVNKFHDYMGSGLIVLWFLVSLLYLFLCEKKKEMRIVFVYLPVLVLFFFFNPLFLQVVTKALDDEIYYRFLWLLPITAVIAYAAVDIYGRLGGKMRFGFVGLAALLIVVSGKLIYANPYFHMAENIYHMPQSIVDICDAIEEEGHEVYAVFPVEMVQYVRQYSGMVCMPYGRDVLMYGSTESLYEMMNTSDPVSAKELTDEVRIWGIHYIIVPVDKKITGSMDACGFEKFAEMDGYFIYKDEHPYADFYAEGYAPDF